MAAVWFTQISNYTSTQFTLRQNDQTWHPIINGKSYQPDEPIILAPRRDHDTTVQILGQTFTVPAGPTILDPQDFFVGWTDFAARTRIEGPNGNLNLMVGPKNVNEDMDYLRIFDDKENEVTTVAIGPRGSGMLASVDLRLKFDESSGMLITIWNANAAVLAILKDAQPILNSAAPGSVGCPSDCNSSRAKTCSVHEPTTSG